MLIVNSRCRASNADTRIAAEQLRQWEESRQEARLGTNYTLLFGALIFLSSAMIVSLNRSRGRIDSRAAWTPAGLPSDFDLLSCNVAACQFFMRGSSRKLKIGLCLGVVLQVIGNVLLKQLADTGDSSSGGGGGN